MPIYKYQCPEHGELERNCPMPARNSQFCECGLKLDRVITMPNVHFKGDGFTTSIKDISTDVKV